MAVPRIVHHSCLAPVLLVALMGLGVGWGSPARANQSSTVTLEQVVRCPEAGGFRLALQPGPEPGVDRNRASDRLLKLTAGYRGCAPRDWHITMRTSEPAAGGVRLSRLDTLTRRTGPAADLPARVALAEPLPLDTGRQIMSASDRTSLGTYDSVVGLDLATRPAGQRVATLTVTIAVAP